MRELIVSNCGRAVGLHTHTFTSCWQKHADCQKNTLRMQCEDNSTPQSVPCHTGASLRGFRRGGCFVPEQLCQEAAVAQPPRLTGKIVLILSCLSSSSAAFLPCFISRLYANENLCPVQIVRLKIRVNLKSNGELQFITLSVFAPASFRLG